MQRTSYILMAPILLAIALLAILTGGGYLWASSHTPVTIPTIISYQGFLTDSSNNPISGTVDLEFKIYDASTGGAELFTETHSGVTLSDGFFSVLLGSVDPGTLTPSVFGGESRYLQVKVGSDDPLPRQPFASVPYAFNAARANTAVTATHAITASVALSVAGSSGSSGSPYARVIVVAESGGDYTSVAEAVASLSNPPSSSSRYLVWVAAGVYTETALIDVPGYVHLQGAGPNVTEIRGNRTNNSPGPAAALVQLRNNARLSDLSVINAGASQLSIAVYMSTDVTRNTVMDNVTAKANGSGGTGHYAVFLNDAEPTIRHSWLSAQGATGFGAGVNAAVGSVNVAGGFPQALIEQSTLLGDTDQDMTCAGNTGTGFGLQLASSAPTIRDSYICGGHRAIAAYVNGSVRAERSHVRTSGTGGAALFEMSGSASILLAASQIETATKFAGGSTESLTCIHSYKSNFLAAADGQNVGTACN